MKRRTFLTGLATLAATTIAPVKAVASYAGSPIAQSWHEPPPWNTHTNIMLTGVDQYGKRISEVIYLAPMCGAYEKIVGALGQRVITPTKVYSRLESVMELKR